MEQHRLYSQVSTDSSLFLSGGYGLQKRRTNCVISISTSQADKLSGTAERVTKRSDRDIAMSAASMSDRKMLYCSLRKILFASLNLVSQSCRHGGLRSVQEYLSASLLGRRFRSFSRNSRDFRISLCSKAFSPPLGSHLLRTGLPQLLTYLADL